MIRRIQISREGGREGGRERERERERERDTRRRPHLETGHLGLRLGVLGRRPVRLQLHRLHKLAQSEAMVAGRGDR